jgi:23S rRNA (cytosine1962-C5)-methyltransferase
LKSEVSTALFEKALSRRASLLKLLESQGTDMYRFFYGAGEGIPGLIVDRYGSIVIFQVREGEFAGELAILKPLAEWCLSSLSVKSIYVKRFIADRTGSLAEPALYAAQPFVGEACEATVLGHEGGAAFVIRPYAGFSTGIFLDQRENRRLLAEGVEGKKVLNGFAYTAAFSVPCARNGAFTVNIDLSPKYLGWAKENFAANALPLTSHRFIAEDVREYLRRAAKRKETFDRIILDPPSFSRNKRGGVFSVVKEAGALVTSALSVLAPGGQLFFSCNYAAWSGEQFSQQVKESLEGENIAWLSVPEVPQDFSWGPPPLHAVFLEKRV